MMGSFTALGIIGVAADRGSYRLKEELAKLMRQSGYEVVDFGNRDLNPDDDYPGYVVPLGFAVARKQVDRGIALYGSGIGACIVANKVAGVRACLVTDVSSVRRGVEDDDLNMICLGDQMVNSAIAWDLVQTFLVARFCGARRYRRRMETVRDLKIA